MFRKNDRIKGFAALLVLAVASVKAELPDGIAVWSEGDARDRTITMRTLKSDNTMGEPVTVVKKGDEGGDIQCQISFDGKWVAFSRSRGGTGTGFGGDDYHSHGQWDIYVARLDGSFPATPQLVGRGYWPSWGEDSRNDTKTLYYSTHQEKTIRKATIDDNGVVEGSDTKAQDIPRRVGGQSFIGFAMMAPNGKIMAWRGIDVYVYFFEDWMGQIVTVKGK